MNKAHWHLKSGHRHWQLADHAIVRVAGVNALAVGSLGSDQTYQLMEEYLQITKDYDDSKLKLGHELGGLLKNFKENACVRNALLNIRKNLLHGKIPKEAWLTQIHEHLDSKTWLALSAAICSLNRRHEIRALHDQVLRSDISNKFEIIKDILRTNTDFMSAMDNVNPNVSERIGSLLNPSGEGQKKWQKTFPDIASRIMRSAIKTSPLSRLTFTVPFSLSESDPALSQGPSFNITMAADAFRSKVAINRGLLLRLGRGLAKNPETRKFLQFQMNNSLKIADGTMQFVIREQTEGLCDKFVESLVSLDLQWILKELNKKGTFYLDEVPLILNIEPGDELNRIVGELIEKSLLIPSHMRGDADLNPIETFLKHLAPGSELTVALHGHFRSIETLLESYAAAAARQRRRLRMDILSEINAVETLVGIEITSDSRRLLYENASAQELRWGSADISALNPDNLASLASLTYILSESWADSTASVERFVKDYGVGGICQNPYQFLLQAANKTEPTFAQDEYLRKLSDKQKLRYKLKADLLQDIADRVALHGDSTVLLNLEDFLGYIRDDIWSFPDSYAVLMQACEQGHTFAINMFGLGFGTLFARQYSIFEKTPAGRKVIASIKREMQIQFKAKGYHQISVNSQQTVNAVPILTPAAIVSAYASPDADPKRSDHELRNLQLIHDPQTDRLNFLTPQGDMLRPVNLGSLVKFYLPPLERSLADLCPEFSFDSIRLVQALSTLKSEVKAIRFFPRISVGPMCLARRSWVVQDLEPLQRMKMDTDFSYKARVLNFLSQNGIPNEVLLYPPNLWVHPDHLGSQEKEPRSKPEFIDFTNQLLFKIFETWSKSVAAPWVFQEMLPHWSDTIARSDGRDLVTEFCFEIYNDGESNA